MIVGKSLGGGFVPISAVLARGEMLDVFGPGEHGSTFGGNPLACAIGRISLEIIEEEQLIENAMRIGDIVRQRLKPRIGTTIKSIRGRGLMIGIELTDEAGEAGAFAGKLVAYGLLCNAASKHVLRFTPPLTISEEEIDWALERLESGLDSIVL